MKGRPWKKEELARNAQARAEFAAWIKERCEDAGVSLRGLSRRTGLPYHRVRAWAAGEQLPRDFEAVKAGIQESTAVGNKSLTPSG